MNFVLTVMCIRNRATKLVLLGLCTAYLSICCHCLDCGGRRNLQLQFTTSRLSTKKGLTLGRILGAWPLFRDRTVFKRRLPDK